MWRRGKLTISALRQAKEKYRENSPDCLHTALAEKITTEKLSFHKPGAEDCELSTAILPASARDLRVYACPLYHEFVGRRSKNAGRGNVCVFEYEDSG